MVKILANGDIVQDDDPRVSQASNRRTNVPPTRQGGFQSAGENREGPPAQQVSVFQSINQQLLGLGIPPFHIGDIVIDPIVSVGLLLALIFFGIHGLIFGGLLFLVSRWSQHGAPEILSRFFGRGGNSGQNGRRDNTNNRGHGRAGGGYRLGR